MNYHDQVAVLTITHAILGKFVLRDHALEIAACADARITELETAITVRDTEIARLSADLELARIGARRYETARRMDPRMWADACKLNLFTGKHFDEIIDELRPFMFPQDAARAGNGGEV